MFEVGQKVVRYYNTDNKKWREEKPKGDIFKILDIDKESIGLDIEAGDGDIRYWNRSNFREHIPQLVERISETIRVNDLVLKREGTESLEWNRFIGEERKEDLLGKTSFYVTSVSEDGEFIGVEGSATKFLTETFAVAEIPKKFIRVTYDFIKDGQLSANDLVNIGKEIKELGL